MLEPCTPLSPSAYEGEVPVVDCAAAVEPAEGR